MSNAKNCERDLNVMEQVAQIAESGGLDGKIVAGEYHTLHHFANGRSQLVHVREIDTTEGVGVCIYSPAAKYKKRSFSGLRKNKAIALLLQNDELCFARFALRDLGEEYLVLASVDLILATLAPEDLRSAKRNVAICADQWEARYGDDEF